MEDLGALGFWLMIGMIVAASIVAEALKEREKQAMLRVRARLHAPLRRFVSPSS